MVNVPGHRVRELVNQRTNISPVREMSVGCLSRTLQHLYDNLAARLGARLLVSLFRPFFETGIIVELSEIQQVDDAYASGDFDGEQCFGIVVDLIETDCPNAGKSLSLSLSLSRVFRCAPPSSFSLSRSSSDPTTSRQVFVRCCSRIVGRRKFVRL